MDEIIYLPPAEEGIEYARRDGSQSAKSTLGAQMKRFKKTVAEKEKELESLWKQWALVQEELEAIAEDALGPKWATILPSLSTGTETETLDDDDDKAFEKKSKQFEKLIETTSEQALEKMIASEMVCGQLRASIGFWAKLTFVRRNLKSSKATRTKNS